MAHISLDCLTSVVVLVIYTGYLPWSALIMY